MFAILGGVWDSTAQAWISVTLGQTLEKYMIAYKIGSEGLSLKWSG
jgi:hypothetical protein